MIKLYDIHNDYRAIFYKGIFYPMVITEGAKSKTKEEIDSLKLFKYYRYYLTAKENTCIKISHFRELKGMKSDYKKKQFEFYLEVNCDVITIGGLIRCCIELKNEQARKSTTISDFIEGSMLTFYKLYMIEI